MVNCAYCGKENPVPPFPTDDNLVTMQCAFCHKRTPTGREDEVRDMWEQCVARSYPKVTAARAIGLAKAIYTTAESGSDVIEMKSVKKKLAKSLKKKGQETRGIIDYVLIKGRTHRGYTDSTTVAAVVVVDNGPELPQNTVYVVFRGSAGDIMAANDPTVNVDWRANFDNRMAETDYAASSIRIHRGFKLSLGSYRDRVFQAMNLAMRMYPGSNLVVTGHSQGAGHALLYTHWLVYKNAQLRPFCIPYSPPRVGNFAFARDFTRRITEKISVLPFDGVKSGAYLMVKGKDPVVFQMKHAFTGPSLGKRREAADSSNIVKQAMFAMKAEKNTSVPSDVYFHPKELTHISSMVPKIGLLKGVDHHPGLFEDKILDDL